MLLKVLSVFVILSVFYQDRRFRAVYWWMFPILIVVLLLLRNADTSWANIFEHSFYNLSFLILQFLLLSLYFSIKMKRRVDITKGYLGWGDILFLVSIAGYFSVLNYFAFYLLSLIIVVVLVLLSGRYKVDNYKIPLAGWQSLLLLLVLLLEWCNIIPSLAEDVWLIGVFS